MFASKQHPNRVVRFLQSSQYSIQVSLQGLEVSEEVIAHVAATDPAPDPLDQIEVRTVFGKPDHSQVFFDIPSVQECLGLFGLVNPCVVRHEKDAQTPSSGPALKLLEQAQKPPRRFAGESTEKGIPMSKLYGTEDRLLSILPRGRNPDLIRPTSEPPSSRQVRMEMELGFVLKPELEFGAGLKGFFFSLETRFLPFRYLDSFLFPLSVCLGRP